ncbi:unnamed protein product [Soboliphyme baturini]|uniref:Mannose-P-dolichol utilization defect 1 protein homolog n=1 Tax=Soboliphyme baturini TaxID=241478 RepID=A0A183J3K8_9BILA|nr:unnamed protein product [Soboliphyme baturini]
MTIGWLAPLITFLFPENCFEELLIHYNFFSTLCVRLVFSRFLGLGIVTLSALVKVPQIVKIWNARSGVGVSVFSQVLELIGTMTMVAYSSAKGFHFSAWGDALFLTLQTTVVIFMILWFAGDRNLAALFLLIFAAMSSLLQMRFFPLSWISKLQASNTLLFLLARGLQAASNYKRKSTGQLSAVTCFLLFGGCLARIFTSVQETGDTLMIIQFVIASIMNFIIFAQIIVYWNSSDTTRLRKGI